MSASLPHECRAGLSDWIQDAELPIGYADKFREFFIRIDQSSMLVMKYCPLCGAKLPRSLRDEWFDRIDALGIEEPDDPCVPPEMRSGRWWREADL